MKIDEIIRNPYYLVAGILLALISLILVGSALAVGCCSQYPNEMVEQNFSGYPFQAGYDNPGLKCVKDDLVEFVAQDGCVGCFDTEKGEITVIEYNQPQVLPLCITQNDLDNWYVTVKVTGGYDPIGGSITLKQEKNALKEQTINVVWEYLGHEECYADYWKAHFVLPEGVNSIELESNQWPDGADPLCPEYATIPDKEVCVSYDTLWEGCHNVCQRFELIQTQKKIVLWTTPTSLEIINFIASLKATI